MSTFSLRDAVQDACPVLRSVPPTKYSGPIATNSCGPLAWTTCRQKRELPGCLRVRGVALKSGPRCHQRRLHRAADQCLRSVSLRTTAGTLDFAHDCLRKRPPTSFEALPEMPATLGGPDPAPGATRRAHYARTAKMNPSLPTVAAFRQVRGRRRRRPSDHRCRAARMLWATASASAMLAE